MARLVDAVEGEVESDFALLFALQDGASGPESMVLATSEPGGIALTAGTRYVRAQIRMERWDSEPPRPAESWDDLDEIPFEPLPAGGPLRVSGFDPPEPGQPGLDVSDLGRSRARVLARHRLTHRHGSIDESEADAEQWIIALWPDPQRRSALEGQPRRLSGYRPFGPADRSPFDAALGASHDTHWHAHVAALRHGYSISAALHGIGRPASRREIQEHWDETSVGTSWDSPVTSDAPPDSPIGRGLAPAPLDTLAALSGTEPPATLDDLLELLLDVGVLTQTRDPEPLLVPNPAPMPVWERSPTPISNLNAVRLLHGKHQDLVPDVHHLLRWQPHRELTATVEQIAVRLGAPIDDLVHAFHYSVAWPPTLSISPLADLEWNTIVTIGDSVSHAD